MNFLTKKNLIILTAILLIFGFSTGIIYFIKRQTAQKIENIIPESPSLPIAPPMPPEIFINASPDYIEDNDLEKTIVLKTYIKNNPTSCSYDWDKNLNSIISTEYFIKLPSNVKTPQTYTITCANSVNQAKKSITLPIVAARPPTIGFSADKYEIEYKDSVTLTWSSQSALSCSLKNSSNKILASNLLSEGEKTFTSLTNSKTYIITCIGPGGITSESVSITVDAPIIVDAPPSPITPTTKTFSFSVDKKSIPYNSSVVLSWSAPNFSYCTAYSDPYSNNWSSIQPKNGEQKIENLVENTVFTLICEDSNGKTQKSVSITVGAASAPAITFSANPSSVPYNSSTALSWSVSNAEACSASGAWHGEKPINGNENTAKLTFNQNYTLTCEGTGGVISKSISITVGTRTYNYIWSTGNWGSCIGACSSGGTQTRQATCKRDDGQSANEDKCTSSKPSTSQKCNPQGYNTNGPYASCAPGIGANCPSSGQGGNSSCTCQTNIWQSTDTCTYNSFSSGGNNHFDCVYTATIKPQPCPQ